MNLFIDIAESGGFDAANLPALYVLSNGNRTVSSTSTDAATAAVSLSSHSTGKYYFEVVRGASNFIVVGVSKAAPGSAYQQQPGDTSSSWGWFTNSGTTYHSGSTTDTYPGATAGSGDVMCVAVDFDNSKIFFGENNVWLGSADPAAGTGAAYTDINGTCRIVLNCYLGSPTTATCNFTSAQQAYSPPSGFSSWD